MGGEQRRGRLRGRVMKGGKENRVQTGRNRRRGRERKGGGGKKEEQEAKEEKQEMEEKEV